MDLRFHVGNSQKLEITPRQDLERQDPVGPLEAILNMRSIRVYRHRDRVLARPQVEGALKGKTPPFPRSKGVALES